MGLVLVDMGPVLAGMDQASRIALVEESRSSPGSRVDHRLLRRHRSGLVGDSWVVGHRALSIHDVSMRRRCAKVEGDSSYIGHGVAVSRLWLWWGPMRTRALGRRSDFFSLAVPVC